MGKIYEYFKIFYARFNRFDIVPSIAITTNKNYTSLDSPSHKEYNNRCLVTVE